ncbi:hypothetical protein H072_9640 [Dactylellina haptotyla CBS 200.50]|uniref:SUI1 domain-containing protein n=1 Tax=Dactylellina haptotyla (strain CBS 200.50) TaxID=1284197 RepID=S8BNW2_DACHA|nr:hypothetical protein H072_9640 [Dactylellina haptotyla CBS 200.50]
MSSKKDMRRADLIMPYQAPPAPNPETSTDISSTMASTLPMAAMFLRNRTLAWASMSFAVQTWLSETPAMAAAGKQPAFFSIVFAAISVLVGQPSKKQFMSFDNFKTNDPFADTGDDDENQTVGIVHIRIQQRNGRKTLTTVQGLPKNYDPKRILKVLKKDFACNGNVVEDAELGEVIQFQGDQRAKVRDFIVSKEKGLGVANDKVKVHGF